MEVVNKKRWAVLYSTIISNTKPHILGNCVQIFVVYYGHGLSVNCPAYGGTGLVSDLVLEPSRA
ncbi:hypothetical protein SAMN04487948_11539 [Halogranum amylolyticum]|uniref:Uncharacterized protein n=1 Tax=Halogranum amylolyticum TaxID=660520 RepID=A0A1H8VC31_9EURY|nr:hypothetical protein SAMN04487948_11539 [Halogranum amylolyticum]